MKKFLFAASVGLICFCTSCNNSTTVASANDNSQAQKNLDASHVINHAFETGDVSKIDSMVASDFVDHSEHGDIKGTDSLKSMISTMHATMKDMKMKMIHEIADNDYVYSWMEYTGTGDGKMMPAGPFDMQAVEVTKFNNGKAVEHWGFVAPKDMMKMMQQMPAMDKMDNKMMNNMDSSKMKNK